MQYLMSVIDDRAADDTGDEQAAIDVFNEQLQAEGYWRFANGLTDPEQATTVDNRHGENLIVDGPFVETKEFLAGFWIIEVPDIDVALTLAAGASTACNRRIELRALHGPRG
jgi:hypothetical protein